MKKGLIIMALVTVSAVSLTGCKTANEKLMDDAIREITMMNDIADQEMDIQEQLENGEITEEEANKMSEKVDAEYEKAIDKISEENTSYSGIPKWAKDLGLSEAKGLKLKKATAHGDAYSLSLDYTGDYETAAAEARRIGTAAGLKEDMSLKNSLENVMEMAGDNMPEEDRLEMEEKMKAIMFSNLLSFGGDVKSIITITVNAEGDLSIAASSEEAVNKATRY